LIDKLLEGVGVGGRVPCHFSNTGTFTAWSYRGVFAEAQLHLSYVPRQLRANESSTASRASVCLRTLKYSGLEQVSRRSSHSVYSCRRSEIFQASSFTAQA